tara:strand:- start:937 stop:1095 length:159 start_codon:yes stop_codon:yes gene_type:complete
VAAPAIFSVEINQKNITGSARVSKKNYEASQVCSPAKQVAAGEDIFSDGKTS